MGDAFVLGLVRTKRPQLETRADLLRRIEEASRVLPPEQLALSPQCAFASGIAGATMSIEEQFAQLRLITKVAREVWG